MSDAAGCFPFLQIPSRPRKPRQRGITIMTDRGLPHRVAEDTMEVIGEAVDIVKHNDHAGLLSRYSEEWFRRKFRLYRQHGALSMPGGIPFELAVLQQKVEQYFCRLKELGFDAVEISEDVIPPLPRERRNAIIRQAIATGLQVVTELGRKVPDKPIDANLAIAMATNDLELGARAVTLEHSELRLFHDGDPEPLFKIVERVGLDKLIFEPNPGGWPWLHVWLIEKLGPDVNLGNVYPEELVIVEAMRLGLTRAVGYPFLTIGQGSIAPQG